jgi:hypothetical protein
MQPLGGTRKVFPLRVPQTVLESATRLAHARHISVNHFISLAMEQMIDRVSVEGWPGEMPAQEEKKAAREKKRE